MKSPVPEPALLLSTTAAALTGPPPRQRQTAIAVAGSCAVVLFAVATRNPDAGR